jgi:hypothetical protein
VGCEEQPFVVYKDVICASSKFFEAACSKRWIEGQKKQVRLPEVEPEHFQSYLAWLCSGKHPPPASKSDPHDVIDAELDVAVELYLLGDILDDIRFRNKMMESLVCNDRGRVPHTDTLRKVWKRTPPASPLRKMYVENFVMRLGRDTFDRLIGYYPPELVQEVAMLCLKRLGISKEASFKEKLASFQEPVSGAGDG